MGNLKLNPKIDIRAVAEYAFWSKLQRQCVLNTEVETRRCEIADDGTAPADAGMVANLERRWQDAYGFRAGASYHMNPKFEVFAGAGWDGTAVPDGFMDPALFDLEKVTASVGARYTALDMVRTTITLMQVAYAEADTTGKSEPPVLKPPTRSPDSGGKYNQAVTVANISVEALF